MKKLKIAAGILWAILCLILIIVLFPGLNTFSSNVSRMPFMKINHNFTGGEAAEQKIMENCTLVIRKPVFDGLIGERRHGFVQLDWRGRIPEILSDTIDYDMDMKPDFAIRINRTESSTVLHSMNPKVKGTGISTPTSYGWSVRVKIIK
ncbi:MAG: hypothetical protein ABSA76_01855 [Bacteroidales bacterium]